MIATDSYSYFSTIKHIDAHFTLSAKIKKNSQQYGREVFLSQQTVKISELLVNPSFRRSSTFFFLRFTVKSALPLRLGMVFY